MNLFENILKSSVWNFLGTEQVPSSVGVSPTPQLKMPTPQRQSFNPSGYAKWYEWVMDETQSPMFKAVQWWADLFTWIWSALKKTVQADEEVFKQEVSKKQEKFISDMLAKWKKKEDIFAALDSLKAEWAFDFKPWIAESIVLGLGNRVQSMGQTTTRLSKIENPIERTVAGIAPYGGQAVAWALQPVTSALEPIVSPVVQKVIEKTGQTENVQELARWWSEFEQTNPILAENIAGLLNVSQLAPVPFAKPVAGAVKQWAVQTGKSLVRGTKAGVQAFTPSVANISQKYTWVRKYLSWLEPKEATALGKTSVEEFDTILNRAKEAVWPNADYTQTPYYVFDEASDALSKIDDNLSTRQAERIAILDEAPISTIDAKDARNTLRSALRSMNVEDIRIVDGKPEIIPVKWREALLDLTNPSDVKALQKLNEILDGDVSPTQTMDRIKKLQEWAYENQSTIWVKGTSERMNKLIKQVQWSLNSTFKKQLPEEYTKVLESMSEDIKLSDDIKRLFGIDEAGNQVWNRGELLMKRILSGTTTGWEARNLAERILKRYGIDFTRQARLRQLAMDIVWDDRWKTIFQSIKEWKSGIVDLALQKTIGKVVDKEWVARKLAKGKWDTIIKPKPLYTPNAFRKAMAEDARMPKALPSPSGKPLSAKVVDLKVSTWTPNESAFIQKRWMQPWTTNKEVIARSVLPSKQKLLQAPTTKAQWETVRWNMSQWEVIARSKKDIENAKISTTKPKPEPQRLLPAPRIPEWTSIPRTDIVAESMRGLSSNVKRPNGTPLRNNKDTSPSANTQWSQQTLKPSPKPLKKTSTNDQKWVVVPDKSKNSPILKKTSTESKWVKNMKKEEKKLLKK